MAEQGQAQKQGRFRRFWVTWRGWLVLALILLAIVALLAGLSLTGIIETGFGEYTPATPNAQRGKTLWDWMELLLVPLALALGAAFFTWVTNTREREIEDQRIKERQALEQRRTEEQQKIEDRRIEEQQRIEDRRVEEQRKAELDRSREAALQAYLDRMTDLIKDGLRESEPGTEERSIARARTLTVLRQLDGERKGLLLQFLHEARLIGTLGAHEGREREEAVVDLGGADLSEADLSGADLSEADLSGADLSGARLIGANLRGADLTWADLGYAFLMEANLGKTLLIEANLGRALLVWADLKEANLEEASLSGTNLHGARVTMAKLSGADLTNAKVTTEQLAQAKSLEGATLPDGTKHTPQDLSQPK
jgi:hypothetical protein